MNKFLCIHGHFYQPPRDNPWVGKIEEQKSAAPHHDWNERITHECYAPNTDTQILNNQNQPIEATNNFSHISFNVGPTLLSWLELNASDTYRSILKADQESCERFSGHGSAIAQCYNHMIMPLSNDRDKETQVVWGIKDFEHRFNRRPEGMWLPETAVNIKTLEILADYEIKYTILAPTQAEQIRRIGDANWVDVSEGIIDTQLPYLCNLPSGKSIVLFFYDGAISNEIAFGKLLKNGVDFADRLIEEFPENQQIPRLVHVANDGETYGHHHAFGNMALAYMLYHVELNKLATITNYGEFLENNPPVCEVQIIEDTSWSCFHGVERWKAHCGCRLDLKADWNQEWRKYLRFSLDWLRDQEAVLYEKALSEYFDNPWGVRDHYIEVVLGKNDKEQEAPIWKLSKKNLSDNEKERIIKFLEMQHYAMLMYTSCGWFFDDISGLETVQILQYAARSMQLAQELTGENLEVEFLNGLQEAKSNIPEMGDGKAIYDQYVRSAMVASK